MFKNKLRYVSYGPYVAYVSTGLKLPRASPSIETHLAVARRLPTKKFLPKCVNEKSSLSVAAKVVRTKDHLKNVKS